MFRQDQPNYCSYLQKKWPVSSVNASTYHSVRATIKRVPKCFLHLKCLFYTLDAEGNYLVLLNKLDLTSSSVSINQSAVSALSCKTGQGLEEFLVDLEKKLAELCANPMQEAPLITSSRQRHHVQVAFRHLEKFLDIIEQQGDLALAGEQLRRSAKQIGSITARGKIDTEEMLDVLFRSFCIGK